MSNFNNNLDETNDITLNNINNNTLSRRQKMRRNDSVFKAIVNDKNNQQPVKYTKNALLNKINKKHTDLQKECKKQPLIKRMKATSKTMKGNKVFLNLQKTSLSSNIGKN